MSIVTLPKPKSKHQKKMFFPIFFPFSRHEIIAPKIISPRLDRELALVDDLLLLDRELAPVDDRELAPVDLLDRELAPVDDLLFSAPYALLISCIALFVPPLSG